MSKLSLEDRLTKLEQQMAALIGASAPAATKPRSVKSRRRQPLVSRNQWQKTLGTFGPEDGMNDVFHEAIKLREQDRRQTQPAKSKKPAANVLRKRKLVGS